MFDGYGNPGALTNSPNTIGNLKTIARGNQAYAQLVNNVIARTQGNAEDAIKKLQRKKTLEAQQKVLEDTKKELEDAPKGLEGERLAKQKSLLGGGRGWRDSDHQFLKILRILKILNYSPPCS